MFSEQASLPVVIWLTCIKKPLKPAVFLCPEQESNLHSVAETRF
jgi:hypothetical protein